jgi:hypothetical protein
MRLIIVKSPLMIVGICFLAFCSFVSVITLCPDYLSFGFTG